MAPRWFTLRVKHNTNHDSLRMEPSPRYTAEDDDVRSTHRGFSSNRGARKSPTMDTDFASSTSLSCEAAQYARHQASASASAPAPVGFEQFSPPFYQRRGFSEEADDALKVGTTLHIHHGGMKKTQRRRSSSEESQMTATYDEKTYDEKQQRKEGRSEGSERESLPRKTMSRKVLHQSSDQDSIRTGSLQSDSMHVLSRLPHGGREAVIYDQKKTIRTMVTILGGWCALIAFCFGFKVLSIKVS